MGNFLEELLNPRSGEEKAKHIVESTLRATDRVWNYSQEALRGIFGARYDIDEIAVWFPTDTMAMTTITALVQFAKFEMFAAASDIVRVGKFDCEYAAQYWFLRKEGFPYRLELMTKTGGFSPFHDMLAHGAEGSCVVAHASFKVPEEESYASAVHNLRAANYTSLMMCDSTYGKFGYFSDDDANAPIKPRLNRRDSAKGKESA